jgi:thiosulfate reductase cytochrome b subunit
MIMSKRQVMLFTRFERVWHWSQMLLIMTLLVTGFAIHGLYDLPGFHDAVNWHTGAAFALLLLWMFAIFWLFTTAAWRHYIPTTKGLWRVIRFYAYGVFLGERHPYRKAYHRKHNPLQALAYLILKIVLFPGVWISGLLYLFYGFWAPVFEVDALAWVALVHTAVAFAIVVFVIVHLYMLTIGHSFRAHVKPMITGFDEVELSDEEEAYLEQVEPNQIR